MDWWIVKQLRAMILMDLRDFVPQGYFESEVEKFKLHDGIKNSDYFSHEVRWGYLAGRLGQKLFFKSTDIMSARQVSASEMLMNLGMLASAEAAQGATTQLSIDAEAAGVSDGNAGAVAEQLRDQHIPTFTNNVRGALKQYLRYLTPLEKEPFLPLLDSVPDLPSRYAECLPDDATTYFNNLCSIGFAEAWTELARTQKEFEREEVTRGRGIGGAGFAARLAKLYENDLSKRTQIIVANLKQVHADFREPLAPGVDEQLKELGIAALRQQYQGLDGAYLRHLNHCGSSTIYPSGLDQKYPLHHATVHNQIVQYLWKLRKVPMKSPALPLNQSTFIFNGSVGAVQTGLNATANVQQWMQGDSAALAQAFQELRTAIGGEPGLNSKDKDELVADIDQAEAELKAENPSKSRLLKWLGGVAAVVQTIGSAQPAFEVVRTAAKALGLPL